MTPLGWAAFWAVWGAALALSGWALVWQDRRRRLARERRFPRKAQPTPTPQGGGNG